MSLGRISVFSALWAAATLSLAPIAARAATPAPAAEAPSPEALARADDLAILAAIRPETERRLDQGPVAFKVRTLRIVEGYALIDATLARPDGSPLGRDEGPPQIASAILRKVGQHWEVDTLRLGVAAPWSAEYCARVPVGLLNDCPAVVAVQ